MKTKVLLLLAAIGLTVQAKACSCGDKGDFAQVARKAKLVAFVKIVGYPFFCNLFSRTTVAMEVEIIDLYRGTESSKKVIVWGDSGNMCRPYVSGFTPGTYYLLALNAGAENSPNTFEGPSDYSLSICGEYWLPVETKENRQYVVSGSRGQEKTYRVAEMKKLIKKG